MCSNTSSRSLRNNFSADEKHTPCLLLLLLILEKSAIFPAWLKGQQLLKTKAFEDRKTKQTLIGWSNQLVVVDLGSSDKGSTAADTVLQVLLVLVEI